MVSKAVSSSKVKRFFTVTATTCRRTHDHCGGAELRSAPDNTAGDKQTDIQVMAKPKDAPFLTGLQPKSRDLCGLNCFISWFHP